MCRDCHYRREVILKPNQQHEDTVGVRASDPGRPIGGVRSGAIAALSLSHSVGRTGLTAPASWGWSVRTERGRACGRAGSRAAPAHDRCPTACQLSMSWPKLRSLRPRGYS